MAAAARRIVLGFLALAVLSFGPPILAGRSPWAAYPGALALGFAVGWALGEPWEGALALTIPLWACLLSGGSRLRALALAALGAATSAFIGQALHRYRTRFRPSTAHAAPIGRETAFPWRPVVLSEEDRYRHVHVVGVTGSGKTSSVLAPMMARDIAGGAGVTVVEPKDGELASAARLACRFAGRRYLEFAPFSPSSAAWNPLAGDPVAAAEGLLYALGRLAGQGPASAGAAYYESVGQSIVRFSVRAIKEARGDEATLDDVRRFLRENGFRSDVLKAVGEPDVAAYFAGTFQAWRADERARNTSGVLAQLDMLLAHPAVRRALCPQPGQDVVDLRRSLAESAVVVAWLPRGELLRLGEAIGTFFLAAFAAAAFSRGQHRPAHFLYVDEFQHFASPAFAELLTLARAYRVGLVLAHQNLAQLRAAGGESLEETILANARTRIVLACDQPDAAVWSEALRVAPEVLTGLPLGRAVVQPVQGGRRGPAVQVRLFPAPIHKLPTSGG